MKTAPLKTTAHHMRTHRKVGYGPLATLLAVSALWLLLSSSPASAQTTSTWRSHPGSNDWDTVTNWTGNALPNDMAIFGFSDTTSLTFANSTGIDNITFNSGASAYTFTGPANGFNFALSINGGGIVNNSTTIQNFVVNAKNSIIFRNSASAGTRTNFTNNGSTTSHILPGNTDFTDTSTAGNGTFTTNGATVIGGLEGSLEFDSSATGGNGTFTTNGGTASGALGGETILSAVSNAGSGSFTTNGGVVNGASGGVTQFINTASAANGTFTTNGGAVSGALGGLVDFQNGSTASSGTFTTNGATVSGGSAGELEFFDTSMAASATLIANGGTGGAPGGSISFLNDSTGGTATVKVFGNGTLAIDSHNPGSVTIGSLEGSGIVSLGANNLTVGSNETSTIFSGVLQDGGLGGSLTVIGGSLTLTGSNAYSGGTTIDGGILAVDNDGTTTFGTLGSGPTTINGVSDINYGSLQFLTHSSAGSGIFTTNGSSVFGQSGGNILFSGTSTAASGNFTNNAGMVTGAKGGETAFTNSSTAANGTFTNNGGTTGSAKGGTTQFFDTSDGGNATLIANSGTGGGLGGSIFFRDNSTGGTARVEVFGNGYLDNSAHTAPSVIIGSLQGDGNVFLGASNLTVGSNNLSTTFSGVIKDSGGLIAGTGGSLTKIGAGALTLSGSNTYTGGTIISGGTLITGNTVGSATGSGNVTVNGTLAGSGVAGQGFIATASGVGHGVTVAAGGMISPGGAQAVGNSATQATGGLTLADSNTSGTFLSLPTTTPSLTFNLGAGLTSSALHLTGTAGQTGAAVVFSNTTLVLNDVTGGALTLDTAQNGFNLSFAYLLVGSDNTSDTQYAGLTTTGGTGDGMILAGLSIDTASSPAFANSQLWLEGGQIYAEVVPEPSTWMLLAGGLGLLMFCGGRAKRFAEMSRK